MERGSKDGLFVGRGVGSNRSVEGLFDHPEKYYPIIFFLVVLLLILYARKAMQPKMDTGKSYLGTAAHQSTMSDIIEATARRLIDQFPTVDDAALVQMVRDDLRIRKIAQVDLYESTIQATVTRLRGGGGDPIQRWTD